MCNAVLRNARPRMNSSVTRITACILYTCIHVYYYYIILI